MTTRRCGSRSRRSALHIDHRATKGSRFSGAISSQRAPHSPSDWQTLKRSWPADVRSEWCPRPSVLNGDSTTPTRSSCLRRCESRVRESPGAPSRISLKFAQPRCRLRMIRGVQRSAKISAPRAMGQYWPYVLTTPVWCSRFCCEVQNLDLTAWSRWPDVGIEKGGHHDEAQAHEGSCNFCDRARCQRSRGGARERRPGRLGGECDDHRWLQLPPAVSLHLW